MAKFKQHIPNFCEGFEAKVFEFNTFKELIEQQPPLLENDKWCYDNYGKAQLLMVQSKDNSQWFVIGYVYDFDLSKHLPKTVYGDE